MIGIEMFSVNSENVPIKERLLNAIRKNDFDSFLNELRSNYNDYEMFLNELLLICCQSSDKLKFLDLLLRNRDIDVNYYDEIQKKTPIHWAVLNGCEDVLCMLLKHPYIDVNILDGDKNSPLHLAAIAGSIECTILLLKCETIKPNQLNKDKQSPIHLASKSNKNNEKLLIEYLRYFLLNLDTGVQENQLIDIEEVFKNCPQIIPVYYLYRRFEDDFISLLTSENRVKLIEGSDGDSTYLQIACSRHLPKVVQALLKHGANPNGRIPNNRHNPLFIASYYGYADIVQIFLDTQNPKIIYQMNEHNTDKVTEDDIWYTSALHEVIVGSHSNDSIFPEFCNYDKTFELLLPVCSELDINYVDSMKNSCLRIAGCINNQYYVHSLLDSGAYLGYRGRCSGISSEESLLSEISKIVLESYLNKCVGESTEYTKSDINYSINCTYKFLCPPKVNKLNYIGHQKQLEDQSIVLQNIPEIEPLLIISKIPELKDLLLHPVLITFIHLKWSKVQNYYYMDLVFYVGFMLCLTFYAIYSLKNKENQYFSNFNYLRVLLLLLLLPLYLTYLIMRELCQIIFFRYKYLKYFENWLEIGLIISTLILLYENSFKEIRDSIYVNVIVILLSWIELMFIMSKNHWFAIQFAMFKVIFKNFVHHLLWYSVLIIAFILSFYIVIQFDKERQGNSTDIYAVSFKTILMFGGEFNVDDDFGLSQTAFGQILIIFFILLISVLLVNTLNGLAVGDIEKVRKHAEIIALESRMHLIHVVESFLIKMKFNTNTCYFRLLRIVTKWLDIKVTVFPDALRHPIINIFPNQKNRVEFNLSTSTYQKGCISSIETFYLDNERLLRAKTIIKSNNAVESKKKGMEKKKIKTVITKWIHEFKELVSAEKQKENNEENMNIIYKAVDEIREIIKSDDKVNIREDYFNALFEDVKEIKNMLITKST